MFVEIINPESRLCAINATALRSSKYDREAESCKGTRLEYYKSYKFYCIATVIDIIILRNIFLNNYLRRLVIQEPIVKTI